MLGWRMFVVASKLGAQLQALTVAVVDVVVFVVAAGLIEYFLVNLVVVIVFFAAAAPLSQDLGVKLTFRENAN